MGYRDAAPRKKRLWLVTVAHQAQGAVSATQRWTWALEGDDALDVVIDELIAAKTMRHRSDVWWHTVVCGEDFAEREERGEAT